MRTKITSAVLTLAVGAGIGVPAQADLIDRGGGLIYDSDRNITWLQNPLDAGGRMHWQAANDLAATFSYYDSVRDTTLTGWRLPTALNPDPNTAPCWGYRGEACTVANTESEMGHLFYAATALGNTAHSLANTGDFLNVENVLALPCGGNYYWTSTNFDSTSHWVFHFEAVDCNVAGLQDPHVDSLALARVWLVRDGDVGLPAPTYACAGFDAPMANGPVTVRKHRTLPLKAELVDGMVPITSTDIIAAPVLQVTFTPATGDPPVDVTEDALPAGQGTVGNLFEFSDGKWRFNLETINFTATGSYIIKLISGDPAEYAVDPVCSATFVIE